MVTIEKIKRGSLKWRPTHEIAAIGEDSASTTASNAIFSSYDSKTEHSSIAIFSSNFHPHQHIGKKKNEKKKNMRKRKARKNKLKLRARSNVKFLYPTG